MLRYRWRLFRLTCEETWDRIITRLQWALERLRRRPPSGLFPRRPNGKPYAYRDYLAIHRRLREEQNERLTRKTP